VPFFSSNVMYADDLLLLWRTESEALSMWVFLQNWNSDNLMRLKLPKCSYVTLGERYSMLESQGLRLQLTHKHLGVYLTARGFDWRSQVDHTARKARRTLTLLRRFCYI